MLTSIVSLRTGSIALAATEAVSRNSVDALWRELEDRKPLVRLGPAPQFDRAMQELTAFLLAILLDQPLQARDPIRSIHVCKDHATSVRERMAPRCALLHSADQLQLPLFGQ
jgi:hypothetical protein